ncbi:ABC transporter substrate-binding protein [Ideonella aquatica]|nr:ABC transporter substrate-binding protein [Ideonella aquatica]
MRPALSTLVLMLPLAAAAATPLQVLHWWTSASERRAVEVLAAHAAAEDIAWRDAAVPGGAGQGAGKVLRSRVLAGDAPDATQIIGRSIADWAEVGVLLELDNVAGTWPQQLLPPVAALLRHRGHTVAAPLGIHRANALYLHKPTFDRLGLKAPTNWAELERTVAALKAAGVVPLAQSSEPWQVAGLAEAMILAEGGVALHRALFVRHDPAAAADPRLATALRRLRQLRGWIGGAAVDRPWTDEVRRLQRGEAAMLLMGDWAKGELLALGARLDQDVVCSTWPGTQRQHLYSIDSLGMFTNDYARSPAQERLARLLVSPAVQADYNAVKGSVPVRRDTDPARLDTCARDSWLSFAQGAAQRAPSMVHRMATDEASKEALVDELRRFFLDEQATPASLQQRLAAVLRTLPQRATDD